MKSGKRCKLKKVITKKSPTLSVHLPKKNKLKKSFIQKPSTAKNSRTKFQNWKKN
jgi:hypothetical protein